jgi:hypothetical protein
MGSDALLQPEGLPKKPLFVFVNQKSGGQQGNKLLTKLRYLLNSEIQVYPLLPDGPKAGLTIIKEFLHSQHLHAHQSSYNILVVICILVSHNLF